MSSIWKALLSICLVFACFPASSSAPISWIFKVFLDDREIGYHHFMVEKTNDRKQITITADFNVRIFFFNAYRYHHTNQETWRGECLYSIVSNTNDNGDTYHVEGKTEGNKTVIKTEDGNKRFDGCIKTFAYWDPKIIHHSQLLNAQTGQLTDVTVVSVGKTYIRVRNKSILANQYRLITDDFTIDLWYGLDANNWLGLKSRTREGTVLRYEIL